MEDKNFTEQLAVEEPKTANSFSSAGTPLLGKFRNVEQLMKAYNELQSEFTRKSQMLKQLKKDLEEQQNSAKSSQEHLVPCGQNETAAEKAVCPQTTCCETMNEREKDEMSFAIETLQLQENQASFLDEMQENPASSSDRDLQLQASFSDNNQLQENLPSPEELQKLVENFLVSHPKAYAVKEQLLNKLIDNPKMTSEKNFLELCLLDVLNSNYVPPAELAKSSEFLQEHILNNPDIISKIVDGFVSKQVDLPRTISGHFGAISLTPPHKPKTIKEASILAQEYFRKNK